MRLVRIAALLCALLVPGVADSSEVPDVVSEARDAQVVILGEVHDNPVHHDNQAAIVAALKPAALVFEMIPQAAEDEVNELRAAGADADQIAAALHWSEGGWPDFAFYAEILAAAPSARVFGAEQSQADVKRSMVEGAAAVFGPDASTYGLDKKLPVPDQLRREAAQAEAHCGKLPSEMLPGMVEAQRLRDAELADAALWARTMTGDGQVVVIAGSGHASQREGVPALLHTAAPDVTVFSLGQFEAPPDDPADFDAILLAPPVARGDPCAGLNAAEP